MGLVVLHRQPVAYGLIPQAFTRFGDKLSPKPSSRLGEIGIPMDSPAGRRQLERYLEQRRLISQMKFFDAAILKTLPPPSPWRTGQHSKTFS